MKRGQSPPSPQSPQSPPPESALAERPPRPDPPPTQIPSSSGSWDRLNKVVIASQVVINIVAIAGLAWWGYWWLERSIDRMVSKQLAVYADVLSADVERQAGHYEEAIADYNRAFETLLPNLKDPSARRMMSALCTGYLSALANCENINKHHSDLTAINKLFSDAAVLPDAADFIFLGTLCLREGDLQQAKSNLEKALKFSEDRSREWAAAHDGLFYFELANGNVAAAFSHIQAAAGADKTYNSIDVDPSSPVNVEYARLYPEKYLPSLQEVANQVEQTKGNKPPFPAPKRAPAARKP